MRRSLTRALGAAVVTGGALLAASGTPRGEVVAVKAGTIHLVEGGQVITGGGTIVLQDGKIVAVGKDVAVPAGAREVDYGPDAVITPGLVALDSGMRQPPSERTADPGVMAVDAFDSYSKSWNALREGVTSMYLSPAVGRLISGQGALVKTAGEPGDGRVVSASTGLHGSITEEARSTPGFWEPRLPATVDVGLGVEQQQLPGSTMGAVIALRELIALARGDESLVEEYGPLAGPELRALLDAGATWRLGANTTGEARAVLEFAREFDLTVVIEGARNAGELGAELAAAGVAVIYVPPPVSTQDSGKGEDLLRPDPEAASKLVAAGVRLAVAPSTGGVRALRFALGQARRGGMADDAALRAITLTPAELMGVADRVGSLAPGKDADLAVFSGSPLDAGSGLIATWIDGEIVWKGHEDGATVLSVDELHFGDGHVLMPGEVLIDAGKVLEVGQRVSRPAGCTVVRGAAAMPGAIDMLGHLGLSGSDSNFSSRFDLSRIVDPGDATDRLVARAGVTTVNLGSRNLRGNSPTMAYRPAGEDPASMVLRAPAALRMEWSNDIPSEVGKSVRETLEKAAEYKTKWEEYEKEIAEWKPEAESDAEEGEGEEEATEEEADEEKKDEKPKKRKKGEEIPAVPATGTWEGPLVAENGAEFQGRLRIFEPTVTGLTANLRIRGVRELIVLTGERKELEVRLSGWTENGRLRATLKQTFNEEDDGVVHLEGTIVDAARTWTAKLTRTSPDYPEAKRPTKSRPEEEKDPKGKPKSPGINPDLEPVRQAMMGKAAIMVSVDRADQILECVDAFAAHGIKPILVGANQAGAVASRIASRVAGVLLSGNPVSTGKGLKETNRYAQLAAAGIAVGFASQAEEGAAGLLDRVSYIVSQGFSAHTAVRSLTGDAAKMLALSGKVGLLKAGLRGDVVLLDGPPLLPSTSVLRVWVDGKEIR